MSDIHKCPVCIGAGMVNETLYGAISDSSSTVPRAVTCKSCGGSGIIVIDNMRKYVVIADELALLVDDKPPACKP